MLTITHLSELGVATLDVATLGTGFPTSCPVASRGSPALNMASFGVTTLGVGFPTSCPMVFRGSCVSICLVGRREEWRRDTRRRSPYFVSIGVPWPIYANNAVLWRGRFSNFVFKGIPSLTYAKYSVFWWCRDACRRFCNVVSNVIPRLTCAKYGVFWRHRERRRDA
jgi:hypothetical protein